jgi:hypothetical protein
MLENRPMLLEGKYGKRNKKKRKTLKEKVEMAKYKHGQEGAKNKEKRVNEK